MKNYIYATLIFFLAFTKANATESYDYMHQVIKIGVAIKVAVDSPMKEKQDPMEVMADNLNRAVQQSATYSNALIALKPFGQSKDEQIAQTAELLIMAITMLKMNIDESGKIAESILNNPNQLIDSSGTIRRKIFVIQENTKTAWDSYTKAYIATAMGVTGNGKNYSEMTKEELNTPMRRIKISSQERNLLKKELIEGFGKKISGDKKNLTGTTLGASFLLDFFNEPKWKTVDQK